MAIKTPPRAARTGRNTARPPTGRPTGGRKKPTDGKSPVATAMASAFGDHGGDVLGLVAAILAVVVALGVYGDHGGPVGHALAWATGAAVGTGRYVVAPILAAVAALLVWDNRPPLGRQGAGFAFGALGALGLLHVGRGPASGAHVGAVTPAGGVVGVAVARPLQALIATPGTVVVCIALLVAATLVITRASLRAVASGAARGAAAGVRPAMRAARKALGDMSTLTSERLGTNRRSIDDGDHLLPSPTLYDVDSEAGPPEAPEPALRKSRLARRSAAVDLELVAETGPATQLDLPLGPGQKRGRWKLPAIDVLVRTEAQTVDMAMVRIRGVELVGALASHGVGTKLVGQTVGPTVTRYELELDEGVKVARFTSLHKDIAYAMAAADVRILAPIPGRKAIGVEVPNVHRHLVALGDLLSSVEAKKATHPLEVAIGKDIAGRSVMLNLATTPHLLIAGATGAGKSSGINCLVTSILMRSTPEQVRLILIDPKRVEMGQYNRLPHLLTQVVTNPKKAANALQWAVKEMERRYDLLHEVGTRDITGYNAAFDRGELPAEPGSDAAYERLPFIVIVVDELNDLMMIAARDVEDSITRIAQMARAVGVHLVIATQRPSVNVLTGVIKANVPARMAFAVSSLTDSRVILDQPGAERLVGKGDMLLLGPASSVAQRIQGAFVTEEEVRKVTGHWRRQMSAEPTYVTIAENTSPDFSDSIQTYSGGEDEDDESLTRQAMELVVRSQLGSTSMLQRKLKVGFARAGRIMDLLEQRGIVGPSEGSKARAVLMTVEEYELLGRDDDRDAR